MIAMIWNGRGRFETRPYVWTPFVLRTCRPAERQETQLTSLAPSPSPLALSHQGRGDSVLVRRWWMDQV